MFFDFLILLIVASKCSLLVKKEARIIRELRLIAYFRQCLPRDFNVFCLNDLIQGFASIHPFQLRLSKIHVIDLHCQVRFSTFLPSFRLLSNFGSVWCRDPLAIPLLNSALHCIMYQQYVRTCDKADLTFSFFISAACIRILKRRHIHECFWNGVIPKGQIERIMHSFLFWII